jgi:predicted RNase H-like HicB family nuclease
VVLDLIVVNTGDGFTADVPSLSGCDSWAHEEDEAINKAIELLRFYLNLPEDTEIKVDKARGNKTKVIYKLVFDK